MLKRIISFSVKNKLLVGLGILALMLGGIYEVTRLPIDAVPDITDNQVQVITVVPSLGAPDVERLITVPIEQSNRNIPGLVNMRSFSRFGLSIVTLVFGEDVDVYWARQQVSERLVTISQQLPPGLAVPTLAPITTGLGEIYQYVLRPEKGYEDSFDAIKLRTLQDFVVRRQLRGVEGVADVSSYGGYQKQYEVSVNLDKMRELHVGMNELYDVLSRENGNAGGTYIEHGMQALFIRTEGLLKTLQEIGDVVVKRNADGGIITVKDVAEVKEGKATRYGALGYNDEGEVTGAVVMMLKGGNSNEVVKKVKDKVAEVQKMLPKGVRIEPFLDRTKMVNNAISTVEKNLAEGALIVVFILVLVLGNLRAGLIVASVIPLAMLFAIIMMNLFGVSGNLMSLGALDFGLIIDGAVIIVESILHQLWKREMLGTVNANQREKIVIDNAGKMMNSAVFGQLIILVVYLPIFSLQHIEGKMFIPMAQTVAFALVGAFLLSLTYVPMMCSWFLPLMPGKFQSVSEKWMEKIEFKFIPLLNWAIKKANLLIALAVVIFGISVFALMRLGGEFIPRLEEGDFAVEARILTGSSVDASIQATQKASKILLKRFPEIEKIVTKVGNGEIPTDPMPMEASDIMIILKDKKEWVSADTYDELAEKMSAAVAEVPGLTVGFQFPVQMRFNELMTGAKQDVVCKVYGDNMDSLAHIAQHIGKFALGIEGAKDIYVEQVVGQPQIVVKLNREKMKMYGLRAEELNKMVEASFAGAVAGKIYEEERPFDLVIRVQETHRISLEDVQNLPIAMDNGAMISLNAVADVSLMDGPNQIQRENAQRRIMIGFNVRGRDVESVVQDVQKLVKSKVHLPAGYWVEYGGSFENLQRAKDRLMFAIPVALLLIWVLLYFAFNSVSYSLMVFSAIPLSLIGGILALVIRQMPFSISAGIGMIALFGVAVLNGIVLMADFKRKEETTAEDQMKHMVIHSTGTRLRPVLMTAAVAALGFMPMALSTGAGAEVQKPLATVVIGGLVTATLLTLLLLPSMYLKFHHRKTGKKRGTGDLNHEVTDSNSGINSLGENDTNTLAETQVENGTQSATEMEINSPKAPKIVTVILLLSTMVSMANAQMNSYTSHLPMNEMKVGGRTCTKNISLSEAISLGKKQNLQLVSLEKQVAAYQAEARYKMGLSNTNVTAELGQVNSWYQDQKYSVSQSIAIPTFYKWDYKTRQSQRIVGELQYKWDQLQWQKDVRLLYYHLQHTLEQFPMWHMLDSVGEENYRKMQKRYAVGDIQLLDLNQAMKVAADMHIQWDALNRQFERDAMWLGLMLGDSCSVLPIEEDVNEIQGLLNGKLPEQRREVLTSEVWAEHPYLVLQGSKERLAHDRWMLEKAAAAPSFQLGYVRQSFQGYVTIPQGEVFYDKSPQFSQVQFSLSLPLFAAQQRAAAQSKKMQYESIQAESQYNRMQFELQSKQLFSKCVELENRILFFQEQLLPASMQNIDIANKQLLKGEINTFTWGFYVKDAMQTYLDYYEIVHQFEANFWEWQLLVMQPGTGN